MAIISLKNSSLFNTAKGFAFQKTTGAVPVLPTLSFDSATTSSYTVAITGYDAQFTYTVSESAGTAVRTDGNITVSGLTANQSSTLTVTAANPDATKGISLTSIQSFFSLPATPTLTQATENATGGTVTITNYDAAATYSVSITAGSATRTGDTITVTGLVRGQSATLTVIASNSSGVSGTATLTVSAEGIGEYEPIATITVPSGGMSSIEFTNIPQDYQHLQIRYIARAETNNDGVWIRLNGDTGTNYAVHRLSGNGSAASAGAASSQAQTIAAYMALSTMTANVFAGGIIDILDYASTSKATTLRSLSGADSNGSGSIQMRSGLWTSTAAVTSIKIYEGSGDIAEHSTFALYGVKAP